MTNETKAPKGEKKPRAKRVLKTAAPAIYLAREALLRGIAAAEARTKGLYEAYASCLNKSFGKGWTKLMFAGRSLSDKEKKLRDQIRVQKVAFYEGAKKRGIANPSDAWNNVKRWAEGGTATQQKAKTGANANAPRVLDVRQKEELSKLYKAGMADEAISDKALEVNGAIGLILRDMIGVDLSTLVK